LYEFINDKIMPITPLPQEVIKALNPIEKVPFILRGLLDGMEASVMNKEIAVFNREFHANKGYTEIFTGIISQQFYDFSDSFVEEYEALTKSTDKIKTGKLPKMAAENSILTKLPGITKGKVNSALFSAATIPAAVDLVNKKMPRASDASGLDPESVEMSINFGRAGLHATKQLTTANLYSGSVMIGYVAGETVKSIPSFTRLAKTAMIVGMNTIFNNYSKEYVPPKVEEETFQTPFESESVTNWQETVEQNWINENTQKYSQTFAGGELPGKNESKWPSSLSASNTDNISDILKAKTKQKDSTKAEQCRNHNQNIDAPKQGR
jgi:hypothetical protein